MMAVERIEVLVEEPSMAAAMEVLLPRMLGGRAEFRVRPSQCKNELLANLPALLAGYRRWLPPTWRLVVVVDRDQPPCETLKAQLEDSARWADIVTKTADPSGPWQLANRIAIEELEAWFFGDVEAVRAAYPRVSPTLERKAPYRDPDAISGAWEALERVLQRAGYFKTGLRKTEAACAIAAHMDPARNRSRSFQVFRDTVLGMLGQ